MRKNAPIASARSTRHASPTGAHLVRMLLACLCLLSFTGQRAFCAAPDVSREYQIKAAFLYNFTKFVEWPVQSFASASDPIVIGVFRQAAFASEVEQVVKDRQINGRAIVVKRIETVDEAKSMHLLFVGAGESAPITTLEQAIEPKPVLTVGESPSFTNAGGVINFVLEHDKVRFEINMEAAERAGLKISAQLQKLAKSVRRGT